jgi:hypothetical protein
MSESKWWATLYDPFDEIIAAYQVKGWARIDALMLTWSLRHHDIEYIKLGTKPPDRSVMFFAPPDEP